MCKVAFEGAKCKLLMALESFLISTGNPLMPFGKMEHISKIQNIVKKL